MLPKGFEPSIFCQALDISIDSLGASRHVSHFVAWPVKLVGCGAYSLVGFFVLHVRHLMLPKYVGFVFSDRCNASCSDMPAFL